MKSNTRELALLLGIILLCLAMMFSRSQAAEEHDHEHDHEEPAAEEHQEEHAHDEHQDEVSLSNEAIQRYGIELAPVQRQKLTAIYTAPGRVAFDEESMAYVGSVVSGRVVELKVRTGDQVKPGDELFFIESAELAGAQSDLLQARTAVEVAQSAVEPAKLAYERAKNIYDKSGGVALAEVQRRDAELKAAEGAVATAEATFAAATMKLEAIGFSQPRIDALLKDEQVQVRLAIRAPIAGQVIQRRVTLGELVTPESDALVVLADLSTVWVIANVPEARLAGIEVGADATVELSASQQSADGKVTYIAPMVDPATRTAAIRVELANAKQAFRPGMFARVQLKLQGSDSETAMELAVPENAVQRVEGETSVFVPVEGEPNTFARRAVTVGEGIGGMIPIIEGLEEGQPVVVGGAFILKAELGKSSAAHEH